jgi:cytoskeletal protein CcmA (bactofilin family)
MELDVKRKPASHSHGTGAVRACVATDDQTVSRSALAGDIKDFRTKLPVIIGEIHFKGLIPVDGSLTGQSGAAGCLNIKQRPSASYATQAELTGEISFRDMVRVNGHVAGVIYSRTGTLIVDANAVIEGDVDVATAIVGGIVRGDIVARERVELGPVSKIYGNIFTPSLVIKDGAIFEGVCRMIDEVQKAS